MSDNQRSGFHLERLLSQIESRMVSSEQRLATMEKRFFIEIEKISTQLEELRVSAAQRRGVTLATQWIIATLIGMAGWLAVLVDFFHTKQR